MTNGERLRTMTDGELAEFLKSFPKACPHPEYADIRAWLRSEDKRMVYVGEKTTFEGKPAKRVGQKTIFGMEYDVIICDGILIKQPKK